MSWWRRSRRVAAGPLSCAEVAEVMQQYLDDESDDVTAGRVAAHLDDCERCGVEPDVYRDIKAALARRPAPGKATWSWTSTASACAAPAS